MPELYDDLVAAGVPIDHHESDLYFPALPEAWRILTAHVLENANAVTFKSDVDGALWIEVPFAYLPWWRERSRTLPCGCTTAGHMCEDHAPR